MVNAAVVKAETKQQMLIDESQNSKRRYQL